MALPREGTKTNALFDVTRKLRDACANPAPEDRARLLRMRQLAMEACTSDIAMRTSALTSRFDEAMANLRIVESNIKDLVELAKGHAEEEWIKYE